MPLSDHAPARRSALAFLRSPLRQLRERPGYATIAIVSLALAIGATTAVFGVVDAVLLRPLGGVADSGRLMSLYHEQARKPDSFSPLSWPDYEYYRDHNTVFSDLMAYLRLPFRVRIGNQTESLSGELVSANYFRTLGVKASLGRLISPADVSAEPVAVISDELWKRHFGAQRDVLGRTLFISGTPFTIIGVAAPAFRGVTLDWGRPPELWIPAALYRQAEPHFAPIDVLHTWGMQSFLAVGRLRDGVPVKQARDEMRLWGAHADADNPGRAALWRKAGLVWSLRAMPLNEARFWPGFRDQIVRISMVLLAVVGGVLLIACANVASLMLTRAAEREREMAARLALGASTGRMARLLLIESLAIAAAGGVGGLGVAALALHALGVFPRLFKIQLALDLSPDPRVVLFTIVLTAACCVGFGLAPLHYVLRTNLANALRSRSTAAGRRERGALLRRALLAGEFALALILLVGAGLFLRTFRNAVASGAFLRAGNLLLVDVEPPPQAAERFFPQFLEQVRAVPGVASAGLALDLPLSGMRAADDVVLLLPGGPVKRNVDYNIVSPGFLPTAGAAILQGRDFEAADRTGAAPVALVNEELARRYLGGDVLGRQIERNGKTRTIVGVVRDETRRDYRRPVAPCLYIPVSQTDAAELSLVVRTTGNPLAALPGIRKAAANLNPDTLLRDPMTLGEYASTVLAQERLAAGCLSALAALAVLLAGVGLYGATSFSVSRHVSDIGIRMALGSTPARIVRRVLRVPSGVALVGLAAGAYGALALARYARSLLYGVSETDWFTWAAGALILILATLAAGIVPGLRAARIDPARALRAE